MILEKITENNLQYAVKIQEELFPEISARANYEESVAGVSGYEYFLVYEGGACVGVTGLYSLPEDPDSAWLGWFGIREGHRRKHLGSAVLKKFEEMAAAKGYRFVRLYTDAVDNDAAIAFYKANGYTCEPYENAEDPACRKIRLLIFSKPLASEELVELVPWNSRNIHFAGQVAKQEKYNTHPEKEERKL